MEDYCSTNLLGDNANNITIPLNYTMYLDKLNLPFADALPQAIGDFNSWDTPALKFWIKQYVDYHNAVEAFQVSVFGVAADAAGTPDEGAPAEGQPAEGQPAADDQPAADNNSEPLMMGQILGTPMEVKLNFDDIWSPDLDNLQKDEFIARFTVNPVLSETYAYYDLFYGDNGIIRRNATSSSEEPLLGATEPATDSGAFLQGGDQSSTETPTEAGETATPDEGASDANVPTDL